MLGNKEDLAESMKGAFAMCYFLFLFSLPLLPRSRPSPPSRQPLQCPRNEEGEGEGERQRSSLRRHIQTMATRLPGPRGADILGGNQLLLRPHDGEDDESARCQLICQLIRLFEDAFVVQDVQVPLTPSLSLDFLLLTLPPYFLSFLSFFFV